MKKEINKAAQALGRLGGQATSEAKTKACRENASKRPNKYIAFGCENCGSRQNIAKTQALLKADVPIDSLTCSRCGLMGYIKSISLPR
jgi:transcription elongation factor Elf1